MCPPDMQFVIDPYQSAAFFHQINSDVDVMIDKNMLRALLNKNNPFVIPQFIAPDSEIMYRNKLN